jgi:MoaA/NifB/PqqE/SkfB family radical SAM enzyme
LSYLHVELTNRCTLECPACPRTTWKELTKRPITKSDLSIDAFEQFMDCAAGQKIETLLLCGDYGDCIYYPELFDFIKRFRHKKFDIRTNGSRRTKEFWLQLADLVTEDDTIVFGIDGLEDTNHIYRKNADWSSIMTAIDIMTKSPAQIKWQTIAFSFNQDSLQDIKTFAESKGTEFFVVKTHRYGNDELVPDSTLIEKNYAWQESFNSNDPIIIEPRCDRAKIVTSDGYYLPCDWIRNPKTFYKSDLWKNRTEWYDRMSIDKINLDQGNALINQWKQLVIEKGKTGSPRLDHLCKMRCRQGCVQSNLVEL